MERVSSLLEVLLSFHFAVIQTLGVLQLRGRSSTPLNNKLNRIIKYRKIFNNYDKLKEECLRLYTKLNGRIEIIIELIEENIITSDWLISWHRLFLLVDFYSLMKRNYR